MAISVSSSVGGGVQRLWRQRPAYLAALISSLAVCIFPCFVCSDANFSLRVPRLNPGWSTFDGSANGVSPSTGAASDLVPATYSLGSARMKRLESLSKPYQE